MRRSTNTDTPLPPEFPAGQNPPDGAIIDYYLADAPAGPVTLEITTAPGRLVRRYSSEDKAEPLDETKINVPLYWLRPFHALPATKGHHRFVWDMRYPAPGAVEHDYPISAISRNTPREPLGVLALPGGYIVKLTVAGQTATAPLTVKMDPRVKTPVAGLQQQFALATRIVAAMNKSYAAIEGVKGTPAERDLERLNNDLATVYDIVEGADATPTIAATKAVGELEERLQHLLPR